MAQLGEASMQSREPAQDAEPTIAYDGDWPPGPVLGARERDRMGSNAPGGAATHNRFACLTTLLCC